MSNAIQPIKVALGADFLSAFSRLPQKQQRKVREFLDKFTSSPDASGLNYEKIHAAKDSNLRSVRIDQDYRGIVLKPQQGNIHVVLWVDKHDDAYRWAERRTCLIHPGTGTMQVVLTSEAAAESLAEAAPAPAPQPQEPESRALFERYSDKELLSLGVPPEMLVHVRAVSVEGDVDRLEAILPQEAFEGVFLLAAGYSLPEVSAELAIAKSPSVDTEDFAAAVEREGTRRQFIVITDAAEMEKILAAPLEQWRVFLHPSQRRLVDWGANGPVRVLGSAGTGKTVVAMHRAARLARNCCKPGEKILFTTFTRNLAADIRSNLKKICSLEEFERIEVVNLDAWVHRFLEKQQFSLRLTYEDTSSDDLWTKAQNLVSDVPFSPEFVRSEWDNVVQSQGIESWEAYMTASRLGRNSRLSRQQRRQIWQVFEEYRALLNERGLCEPADAFRAACRLIAERKISFPYRSVVVDEAQDFGNEAFRLIRALVPPGENDLFIVGDAHQRLYGHQVVLSRCGIDIRGRGRKLRINYRTTEELKNWATGLLKGQTFDDLDAGLDEADEVRSLVHGEPPVIVTCQTEVAAAETACAHIKELFGQNVRAETVCVVARTRHALERFEKHLKKVSPEIHRIKPDQSDDSATPGLRLATIQRVKGLEFDHVILVDRLECINSPAESGDKAQHDRALIYVAATRARRSLLVCRLANS